jgi:YHS domain-containing protein
VRPLAICPVCGFNGIEVPVNKQEAIDRGLISEYKGKTYYFEDAEHKRIFDADPERYKEYAEQVRKAV